MAPKHPTQRRCPELNGKASQDDTDGGTVHAEYSVGPPKRRDACVCSAVHSGKSLLEHVCTALHT